MEDLDERRAKREAEEKKKKQVEDAKKRLEEAMKRKAEAKRVAEKIRTEEAKKKKH